MHEYTVIKKGQMIQPCIDIPDEFRDIDLEIKIRPLHPKRNVRSALESLFSINEGVKPFETIQDAAKWQDELRDEWE